MGKRKRTHLKLELHLAEAAASSHDRWKVIGETILKKGQVKIKQRMGKGPGYL